MNINIRQNISQLFDTVQSKTFALLGFTILVTFLFFILAIRPTLLKISEVQNEILVNSAYRDKLETKITNIRQLSKQITDSQENLTFMTKALDKNVIDQEITANIDEIVRQNGFETVSITAQQDTVKSIDKPDLAKKLASKVFLVQVKSTNGNLQKLVEDIEKYPRPLIIQKISISNSLNYQFQIDAFYLK